MNQKQPISYFPLNRAFIVKFNENAYKLKIITSNSTCNFNEEQMKNLQIELNNAIRQTIRKQCSGLKLQEILIQNISIKFEKKPWPRTKYEDKFGKMHAVCCLIVKVDILPDPVINVQKPYINKRKSSEVQDTNGELGDVPLLGNVGENICWEDSEEIPAKFHDPFLYSQACDGLCKKQKLYYALNVAKTVQLEETRLQLLSAPILPLG